MPVVAEGFKPALGAPYNSLWTRDNAYTMWHDPGRFTAAQRRQFVSYYLSRRSTGAEADPDGGTLPANYVADRIDAAGVAAWKNAGASTLPFADGIAFVVLALWVDWNETGDTSTFTTNQTAIDACLAALPRAGNGCVTFGGAGSVDYGFTDSIKKTGDVTYGTALLAWAYRMLSEIAGENGVGTYSTAFATAKAGLATLRKPSGWYKGSSNNQYEKDDVWATALIVAENLLDSPSDRLTSAYRIVDSYQWGQISSGGWVRHLPEGQFWVGATGVVGDYQNGGYWLTPLWDCYRAAQLIDQDIADGWANAALNTLADQIADEGTVGANTAPYEWFNDVTVSVPKGYTPSAAIVRRFVS